MAVKEMLQIDKMATVMLQQAILSHGAFSKLFSLNLLFDQSGFSRYTPLSSPKIVCGA